MISKTRGIVFHHLKFGDTDIIATVYTEQFGRKSFLIKGVYKAKARFRANMFQPLSLLDLEISLSGKRDLQRVKDVILSNSPANINGNISKQTLIFFIAEVLYKNHP
ncbi:MAG: hypothetical protein HC905_10220 [Bacteroidales bacterium]|nr:hypothetical protein [Bacteroidales bacterium]